MENVGECFTAFYQDRQHPREHSMVADAGDCEGDQSLLDEHGEMNATLMA